MILVALFGLSACAGMRMYPTGLTAAQAPKVFAALEVAAAERGYEYSNQPTSMNVKTSEGWIQYMIREGAIDMVILPDTDGLDKPAIAERGQRLKVVGDELLGKAREQAASNAAFDPRR